METAKSPKIAIVHPWFLAHGGAESVVDILAEIFPDADFFTIFYVAESLPRNLRHRKIMASSLNWLPLKYTFYRYFLAVYPFAFEQIDLRGYDLVITSDSCLAKGVVVDQGARHICYCHSPMRALWDKRFEFRDILPKVARTVFTFVGHFVRQWDFQAAQRVDQFIANSNYVAERIAKYYRRQSTIIYPPVVLASGPISNEHGDYYLSVGRLTETKRVDLLIDACNRMKRRLIVVGGGRQERALRKRAGSSIEFRGHATNEELDHLYRNCRALLFAADEDFGIVPVEAQGYGRPVIALGHGGTLETVVIEGQKDKHGRVLEPTGVFFYEQTVDSVCDAIMRFEAVENRFDAFHIRAWAEQFSHKKFGEQLLALVQAPVAEAAEAPRIPPPHVGHNAGQSPLNLPLPYPVRSDSGVSNQPRFLS